MYKPVTMSSYEAIQEYLKGYDLVPNVYTSMVKVVPALDESWLAVLDFLRRHDMTWGAALVSDLKDPQHVYKCDLIRRSEPDLPLCFTFTNSLYHSCMVLGPYEEYQRIFRYYQEPNAYDLLYALLPDAPGSSTDPDEVYEIYGPMKPSEAINIVEEIRRVQRFFEPQEAEELWQILT